MIATHDAGAGRSEEGAARPLDIEPQPPFVWPEPRVQDALADYKADPPFDAILRRSNSLVALIAAPAETTLTLLAAWLEANKDLNARVLLAVYPTCVTRRSHMEQFLALALRFERRLQIRVRTYPSVTNRPTSILGLVDHDSGLMYLATGASEDLGGDAHAEGKLNFVFRAEAGLIASIHNEYTCQWGRALPIEDERARSIPTLVLPEGTEEGARLWRDYCAHWKHDPARPSVVVDVESGAVTIVNARGQEEDSPFKSVGMPMPDRLSLELARIYERGSLVSIDKLSRVPPLDAPLSPRLLGDEAERQAGGVKRTVSVRVSIFPEADLKEFEKRRKAVRDILDKFTYGLADGMRWMPHKARKLFDAEMRRVENEGRELLGKMIQGKLDEFIKKKRDQLAADIGKMLEQLGRRPQVDDDLLESVMKTLKERVSKSQAVSFTPTLTFSSVGFAVTTSTASDSWGQASSFLYDLAAYPRTLATSDYFLRGLQTGEPELVAAMNVADDCIVPHLDSRAIKPRAKEELLVIKSIRDASLTPRDRCEFTWRVIRGDRVETLGEEIEVKGTA